MRKILIAAIALILVVSFSASAEMMSFGFIPRAEVRDGITIDAGAWLWVWPAIVWGFGVNGTGESAGWCCTP